MAAAKKKRKAPRETSDRVSRIAAKVLRAVSEFNKRGVVLHDFSGPRITGITASELAALAASCLAQDQTRGRRDGRVKR